MLRKASSRRIKWILAPIAGVLTAAIVAGTIYDTSEDSVARVSLPGIEKINQSNGNSDPFTILEIVPSYSNARVGYFVEGEEPVYYDDEHGVLSLADMGSYGEREDRYGDPTVYTDSSDSLHYFSAYNELVATSGSTADGPFAWNDNFYENDPSLDPSDPLYVETTKTYTTYGSYAEKSTSTTKDYANANDIDDTYKLVVSPSETDTAKEPYKLSKILSVNYNETTGQIYDDEVEYTFTSAAGGADIVLTFSPITAAKSIDPDAEFPYQLDSQYDPDPTVASGPFNWSYYEAKKIEFTPTYDTDGTTILSVDVSIPTDELYPVYVDTDGADAEGYYNGTYLGYVYHDDVNGWCFMDFEHPDTVNSLPYTHYVNILGDSTVYSALYSDYTGYYGTTYPDAVYYAMGEYKSWDSDTLPNNLYYVSSASNDGTKDFAKATYIYKVNRISAGQDPTQYGFRLDDSLTYHSFYYLLNKPNAEYVYTTDLSKAKYKFISDYRADVNETFTYNGGFENNEWFKRFVLDRDETDLDNTVIDVVTKLAKDVEVADIENADLIYINGVDGIYTTANDIKEDVAKAILSSVKSNKAVVIDATNLIYNCTDASSTNKNITSLLGGENLVKLAVAMLQPDFANDDLRISTIDEICGIADWHTDTAFLNTKYGDKRNVIKEGYTAGSVFITPDTDVYSYSVFSKVFFTELNDGVKDFAEVNKSIQDEIFFLKIALGEEGYKAAGFNDKISYATVIRHILSYGNRRVSTKDSYRVLDIEPFYSDVIENKSANTLNNLLGNSFRETTGYDRNSRESGTRTYTDRNAYSASNRDIFSKEWFINNICETKNPPKNITVTGMGTREFVGKIEDICTEYDLIYIGMDTMYMNTSNANNSKSKNVVYNDGSMNGLVYTHIGDWFDINTQMNGWSDAPFDLNNDYYHTGGNDITFEKFRELTTYVEAGYAVLLSDDFFKYGNGGKITGINTDKVDVHSYMYDFIKFCLYGNKYIDGNGEVQSVNIATAMSSGDFSHGYIGRNVNIKKTFDGRNVNNDYVGLSSTRTDKGQEQREEFVKYLNVGKLLVTPIDVPDSYYDGSTTKHYLSMKNGKYTLDYDIELTNLSDVGSPTYDCKLYIDVDADGRYAEIEAQTINTIESDGTYYDKDSSGYYHLSTGRRYHISMDVPEGFKGFLSWKLEFVENDRESVSGNAVVKSAITGYSAVPVMGNREPIRILQIFSGEDNAGSTHLDLASQSMKKLYEEVQDFEIIVDQTNAQKFVDMNNADKLDYLMGYDMLVLGFADSYRLPVKNDNDQNVYEAIYAFREYVLSGRSVLFTHDLTNQTVEFNLNKNRTQDNNGSAKDLKSEGTYINEYMRDIQGMDRYGATRDHLGTLQTKIGNARPLTEYISRYDDDYFADLWGNNSYKSKNTNGTFRYDTMGLSQSVMLKYHGSNGSTPTGLGDLSFDLLNGLTQSQKAGRKGDQWGDDAVVADSKNNYVTEKISQVNTGQITEYPFHIEKEIPISMTHSQYYQLNLDTDTRDDNYNDDVVVWYTLSGDDKNALYYGIDRNDVRNNYYIFNKGNITYTGSGHTIIGEDRVEERKLFVNTLVAAYTVGKHAPTISFKESPWSNSSEITAKYEPYDVDLLNASTGKEGGTLGDKITVNFKVVNNNLKDNVTKNKELNTLEYRRINVRYYVEDVNGNVTINGMKFTEINPSDITLKKVVDSAGNTIANSPEITDNASKLALDNYAVYTADIKNSYFVSTAADAEDADKLVLNKHSAKLYIRACMDDFDDVRAADVLPATESMNSLEINFTELYELK